MLKFIVKLVANKTLELPDWIKPEIPNDVEFREGHRFCLFLGWLGNPLHPFSIDPVEAVTLGNTIIVKKGILSYDTVKHELVHVPQWKNEKFFFVKYIWSVLQDSYRGSKYEREAFSVSDNIPTQLANRMVLDVK